MLTHLFLALLAHAFLTQPCLGGMAQSTRAAFDKFFGLNKGRKLDQDAAKMDDAEALEAQKKKEASDKEKADAEKAKQEAAKAKQEAVLSGKDAAEAQKKGSSFLDKISPSALGKKIDDTKASASKNLTAEKMNAALNPVKLYDARKDAKTDYHAAKAELKPLDKEYKEGLAKLKEQNKGDKDAYNAAVTKLNETTKDTPAYKAAEARVAETKKALDKSNEKIVKVGGAIGIVGVGAAVAGIIGSMMSEDTSSSLASSSSATPTSSTTTVGVIDSGLGTTVSPVDTTAYSNAAADAALHDDDANEAADDKDSESLREDDDDEETVPDDDDESVFVVEGGDSDKESELTFSAEDDEEPGAVFQIEGASAMTEDF